MFRRYTLYELVVTAVMAALGIAIKPLVVPLAHLVCGALMIPSGALAGGLYMMWLVIGYGIVKKPGTALIISVIQALLVIFTGIVGSHGVMSLLTYIAPGIAVELVMLISRHRGCCQLCCIAGGILSNLAGTAAVNIVFFQAPGVYLILILSVSAISGMVGGIIGWSLISVFEGFGRKLLAEGVSHTWLEEKAPECENVDMCEETPSESVAAAVNIEGKKKRHSLPVVVLAAALIITVGITAFLNGRDRVESFEGVAICLNGETLAEITIEEIMAMDRVDVTVNLSSSSKEDVSGTFSGVMLEDVLKQVEIDAGKQGDKTILLTAGDGYSTAASADEADTVLIAYEHNGNPLGYYTQGGTGPLRAVFTKDQFGNRSCMNLVKIDIR